MPNDFRKGPREIPRLLRQWFKRARSKGGGLFYQQGLKGLGARVRARAPQSFRDFDFRKVNLRNVSEQAHWIKLGLVVIAIFVLAEITSRAIRLFLRPIYPVLGSRTSVEPLRPQGAVEDYDSIVRRNMFNVEGTVPDPFDQGKLDCFSQAKPSSQRLQLLGTIVMGNEDLSAALLQEEGNPLKQAVRKGETFFDGKYEVLKIERKRFCFQVKASQEYEYIEIPEDSAITGLSAGSSGSSEGVIVSSDTEITVKKDYLEKQMLNLNEILQTARAVPHIERETGKFKGFLVQSIEPSSPFAQLGVRQGDILTGVNDIILDNPGKGLEAFQSLRHASSVNLRVIRGGQEVSIHYQLK